MSRSVDLFIDASQPIEEMASFLGDLMGSPLVRDPSSGGWVLSEGEVQATLSKHPFVDDDDLLFTHFRYALSARVSSEVRLQDSPAAAFLRRVADRIQRGLGLPVLLVLDLQYRDHGGPSDAGMPPASDPPASDLSAPDPSTPDPSTPDPSTPDPSSSGSPEPAPAAGGVL